MPTVRLTPDEERELASRPGATLTPCRPITVPDGTVRRLTQPNEKDFQAEVIEAAQRLGWKVLHIRRSRTKKGWLTAVAADGKGFPDLLMVRGKRCLVAELKVSYNKPTPEQREWLAAFDGTHGVEACLWTPRLWKEIEEALR